jgi:hypothetical protein
MKKCIQFPYAVLILFLGIYPINSTIAQTANPLKNKFSFGIVNMMINPKYRNNDHLGWYGQLKLDLNMSYTNRDDNAGFYGGFKDSLIWYSGNIDQTLNFDNDNLKTI